jgi:hypothetical protein
VCVERGTQGSGHVVMSGGGIRQTGVQGSEYAVMGHRKRKGGEAEMGTWKWVCGYGA